MKKIEKIIEALENYGISHFKSHDIEEIARHLETGGYIASFDSGNSGEDDTIICYDVSDFQEAEKYADEIITDWWLQIREEDDDEDRPDSWQITEVLKIADTESDDIELIHQ